MKGRPISARLRRWEEERPYRVEVSLVELVHSSLELAALALPLLKVADRFHGGTLPCGGASVVVNIVDPAPVVHSPLPTAWKKTATKENHFI